MRRGFVLVATLWTVVVVFLLVESIDRSVGDELERMIRVRDRIDDRMDLVATESLVKYYVMTHRATAGGYVFRDENPLDYTNFEGLIDRRAVGGEIRVDGTTYLGVGDVRFALRDERGLLPINSARTDLLELLLLERGRPRSEIDKLIGALTDYRDRDGFAGLRGAEGTDYEALEMTLPRNDFLRSPREIERVLGWRELAIDPRILSDRRGGRMNFNAIPEPLLPVFFGAAAATVQAERLADPFYSLERVRALAREPDRWTDLNVAFVAGDQLRLELGAGNQCLTIALELTPFDRRVPIRERFRYEMSCDARSRFPVNATTKSLGAIAGVDALSRDA